MKFTRPFCISVALAACFAIAANATPIDGYASMGASATAGDPLDYTGSWVPYLTLQRGLNFGGPGNPYNVAVGGAKSNTLLTQNQHTAVAALVQSGDVDLAFLSIGGNDYSAVSGQIASGVLSGPALTAWAQGVVDNIAIAMDTVIAAGPAGMIVTGMGPVPLTPNGRLLFDTPVELARGEAAVDLFDSLLMPAVLSRGLTFIDYAGSLRFINQQPLYVGGVLIDVVSPSADPTHFFKDGVHPAAVGNGLLANTYLSALNIGYGTNYPLFSDLEILTIAGLGNLYTGETSNLPYEQFVVTPVPEPSTLWLAGAALVLGVVIRRRKANYQLASLTLVTLVICPAAVSSAPIDGYANMGASESAGTTYTGSWVPYLANQRGFNFGGAGQPYNVAVGGARSSTLLTQGQHTAVQSLVQSGDVDLAYLFIGGNDFFSVGLTIADGSLSGPALDAWAQSVVTNIGTAMDTVLSANPVGMVVMGMPDVLLTPAGRSIFDTPAEIARGTAAVDLVNSMLLPDVLARGQVFVDLTSAMRDINAAPLLVGGLTIDTVNASSDPTHFFQDGRHPAAVGNGITANLMLTAVNVGYGTSHLPLSDLEILTTAGLAGLYTGETSGLPYADYIITPVPEPSTIVLAGLAILCLAGAARRTVTSRAAGRLVR